MKALITGAAGQLGRALLARAPHGWDCRGLTRDELDLTDPGAIGRLITAEVPDVLLNAAAYTAVDRAESEEGLAFAVNSRAVGAMATALGEVGGHLVHVSTDFVFDGTKGAPYGEDDPTHPMGVYGASKLGGETAVLAACPRAVILRTSWVYAARGRNFVLTMLNLARSREHLRVVADQLGCPTAADDLAAAILGIADRIGREGWQDDFGGVFHAAGGGETTWHGLACAAIAGAGAFGHPQPKLIEAITTAEYPTPARRPADSRLDGGKLERVFGLRLPPWEQALERTIGRIFAAAHAQ